MTALVIRGDARHLPLPDACVDLCVTSPPYFSLRSYSDGGQHYQGQVGSEATPQEFLEALWECTAEMMRVLKPSGSIFINLGDVYSSGQRRGASGDYVGVNGRGVHRPGALSEWTKANAAWLAAVLDCEGSVSGRIFTNSGGGDSFVVWMRVGMMDRQVVDRIYEITGVGRVFQDKRGVWNWHVASQAARYVLERIWPWLRIKQKRALTAIELCRHVEERAARGFRRLTPDDLSYRAKLVQTIRDWNGHPPRSNDYEPPTPKQIELPDRLPALVPAKSLQLLPERYRIGCVDRLGLIARAVIVWHKPNGLPESVTDRVRRSHEDWVHLTKQSRYYSAIDEIREEQVGGVITGSGAKRGRGHGGNMLAAGTFSKDGGFNAYREQNGVSYNPLGKLPGSVWTIKDESSLARFVLEAVKSGSLSLDEGERIWTGRPAYGQRSPAILTDAGNGSESSTGTATDDTGRPPKVTDEHTDSSTNSPSDSSPMDSLSTTPATTQISTASEASPAHTADASTQHTLSQSPSQPTSHDEHGKITAPQAISTTNQTPTSVQAEGASAEPVWLREAANIAEHTAPPSVWKVATEPLTVPDHLGIEHFAAYPTEWPKRLIRGWSPPGICLECGEGRRPVSVATLDNTGYRNGPGGTHTLDGRSGQTAHRGTLATVARHLHSILGYVCACTPHTDHPGTGERYFTGGGNRGLNTTSGTRIPHVARGDDGHVPKVGPWREYHFDQWTPAPTRPAVILDPFSGTGTTTLVASALGRIGIGVDLSHDYGRLAQWRTTDRAQIAKVLEVPKPPVIPQAQTAFDFGDAS